MLAQSIAGQQLKWQDHDCKLKKGCNAGKDALCISEKYFIYEAYRVTVHNVLQISMPDRQHSVLFCSLSEVMMSISHRRLNLPSSVSTAAGEIDYRQLKDSERSQRTVWSFFSSPLLSSPLLSSPLLSSPITFIMANNNLSHMCLCFFVLFFCYKFEWRNVMPPLTDDH